MPARIGPMHGDQPAANPKPTTNEASSVERFALGHAERLSIIRNGILKTPIMFSPSMMTTTPPTLAMMSRCCGERVADRARRKARAR